MVEDDGVYDVVKAFLEQFFEQNPHIQHLAVAISGGCDSTVLLHNVSRCIPQNRSLEALYFEHSWNSQFSKQCQTHCTKLCNQLQVPLTILSDNLTVNSANREAEARNRRYTAMWSHLPPSSALLVAHTRDDQIETLFMRLLRGGGVKALAGMQEVKAVADNSVLVRPMLEVDRSQVELYARQHDLVWCEDPSNSDTSLERNYWRHNIVPVIEHRYPKYQQRIAHSLHALATVAEQVRAQAQSVIANSERYPLSIDLADLRQCTGEVLREIIDRWCRDASATRVPQHETMVRIQLHLDSDWRSGQAVEWGDSALIAYRNQLYLLPHRRRLKPLSPQYWQLGPTGTSLAWDAYSTLTATNCSGMYRVLVRRYGADIGQVQVQHGLRQIKLHRLWQKLAIPTWSRSRTPVILTEDSEKVLAIGDYWYCEQWQQSGIQLQIIDNWTNVIQS